MSLYKSANLLLSRSLRNQRFLAHNRPSFLMKKIHTQFPSSTLMPALKEESNQIQQAAKQVDAVHSAYYNNGNSIKSFK